MKPLSQLKSFRSARTAKEILTAFLAVTNNPKRHLRGPFLGKKPGNGKEDFTNDEGTTHNAVCGCAAGILDLVTVHGFDADTFVNRQVRQSLHSAAEKLYGAWSFTHVSDRMGLTAIRRVVREALKNIS